MHSPEGTVFIIDDDASVRGSLALFLSAEGYQVEKFAGSDEFLARDPHEGTGCILLDVNLPGRTGLDLQEELVTRDPLLPIIFITGYGNIPMTVHALKKGALNFLEKPFSQEELLRSVSEAMRLSRNLWTEREEISEARSLISKLSPREQEILGFLMTGMLNKQIASELKIAEHTVKLHRHSICEKLGVKSVPEIMRIADKAGLSSGRTKVL